MTSPPRPGSPSLAPSVVTLTFRYQSVDEPCEGSKGGGSGMLPPHQNWTPEAVRELGMTTDLETAAIILGIGRTLAYQLAKTDRFPVRLLRLGRRVLVPTGELLTYLGHTS